MPLPRRSGLVGPTAAWRSALWRRRHAFLALALAAGLLAVVEAAAPVPAGTLRVVLTADVAAGQALDRAVVDLVPVPDGAAPNGSFTATADVLGRQPLVGLPAGTVLSGHLLLGSGIAVPAGHLAMPVAVADAGSRALAQPGTRVTLIGVTGTPPAPQLWSDVLVLSVLDSGESSFPLGDGERTTIVVVAVPSRLARVVAEASAAAPLRVALPDS